MQNANPHRQFCLSLATSLALSIFAHLSPALSQPTGIPFIPRDALSPRQEQPTTPENTKTPGQNQSPSQSPAIGWSIILASFRGDSALADANAYLTEVKKAPELANAFAEKRGTAAVIAIGSFTDSADPAAQTLLKTARELKGSSGRPLFPTAFLAPQGESTNVGNLRQYHLSQARQDFPGKAVYTLQVGAYGRPDPKAPGMPTEAELAEARKTAEAAVAKLRSEGELAWYFHGPRMSLVCIGVFSEDDLAKSANQPSTNNPPNAPVVRARAELPQLTALRDRFPHNLYNGQGIRTTSKLPPPTSNNKPSNSTAPSRTEQLEPSLLVRIPAQ